MKHSLVIAFCLVASSLALADVSDNGEVRTPAPAPYVTSPMVMKGVNVNAFYSTANSWEIKGNVSSIGITEKIQTDSAPGLGLRYASIPSNSFGFLVGGSFSFSRNFHSADASTSNGLTLHATADRDVGFSLLSIEPNAAFGIGNNFYVSL
jgi:hypothetical protein